MLRSMVSLRIRRHFLKTFAPTYWTSENCLWKPNLEIEGKLKIKLDTHLPPELKVNVDNRLKVAAKWNRKGGICRFNICWKQAGPVNGFIDFALNIGSHSTQKWKNNFLIHVFTSATTHVLWYSVRWASCYSSSWTPGQGSSSLGGCRPGQPTLTPAFGLKWRSVGNTLCMSCIKDCPS